MAEQLYRLDYSNDCDGGFDCLTVGALVAAGVLVPVEACEHGNYARHLLYNEIEPCIFAIDKWCPGAGNGDTDEDG